MTNIFSGSGVGSVIVNVVVIPSPNNNCFLAGPPTSPLEPVNPVPLDPVYPLVPSVPLDPINPVSPLDPTNPAPCDPV